MSFMDSFPSTLSIPRPEHEEATSYFFRYIDQVEGNDALSALQQQYFTALNFYKDLPSEKWDYRYEEGKWSIKQLLLHVLDAERIFAYRALRIARGDKTPMAGFNENNYADISGADQRSALSLIEEYKTVRLATYSLFENLPKDQLNNLGMANDASVSCRALAWMIAGHEKHHLTIIRERYL